MAKKISNIKLLENLINKQKQIIDEQFIEINNLKNKSNNQQTEITSIKLRLTDIEKL